jgi:hypothetical protein
VETNDLPTFRVCRDDGNKGSYVILRKGVIAAKRSGYWINVATSIPSTVFEELTGQRLEPGEAPVEFRMIRVGQ